ncbi:AraC family transcriptional regulator [Mycolicibacterium sp. HS_4_1]
MADIDARLSEARIPPSVLVGLIEIGQREGHPVAGWFAGTGVDPGEILTSPSALVSFRQAATILRRALRAMPNRPVGMQVGARDALLTFGMLGMAMRACTTVAEAVALGTELHEAAGSLVDIEIEEFGSEFALRLYERHPEPDLVAFLCEEAFCSSLVVARGMNSAAGTAGVSPSHLELSYPEPDYGREYRRFFGCPVTFGGEANRMIFPAKVLDAQLPTHHQPTRAMAVDACRRLLGTSGPRPDIVVAVETLLMTNLRRTVTMTEAAESLYLTERTLRRQLSAAGESFTAIRDRVREQRATLLLTDSALPVGAIAAEVGFSDQRDFRRAYRRWTGRTPSAVRSA